MALKKRMRMYLPIWEALKQDRNCTVICNSENRARIIKAVIKEKDMDIEFKEIHGCTLVTYNDPDGVTFSLVPTHPADRRFK